MVAKYLDSKLKPLLSSEFLCRDSFEFVDFISTYKVQNEGEFMVSFDISSLFTNVPLVETLNLCCDLWKNNHSEHHIVDEVGFRELLSFATSNVHFLFNNEWYKQTDGVAMGSPLAPTLASVFLSKIENKIKLFDGNQPLVYKRYVDDIFLVFKNQADVLPFLNFMNSLHSNVTFTVENEKNGVLPFLDLLVERKSLSYETGIYRKQTDTGLYTSPDSFCELKYKRNMIKGLIYRSWSLSSTFVKSVESVNKLSSLLNQNGYSKSFLEKLIKETVDKILLKDFSKNQSLASPDGSKKEIEGSLDINNMPKYCLIVPYSEGFKNFKNALLKATNNELNLKIISRSHKIQNMFSNKSITPLTLCSDIVYEYKCNGCDATYIGETARHLCKRIQEHGRKESKSNIAEHRKKCKCDVNFDNFKILCKHFDSYWERVSCEALLIRSRCPKINVQSAVSTSLLRIFD